MAQRLVDLCKVFTNGINYLHTRPPLCVLAHANSVVDLAVIEANALTWEVEDGFPYAHPIDEKATFLLLYERYKVKVKATKDNGRVLSYSCWI